MENKLLCKLQSGFLPNNSTVYQLIEIYHEICINRELKKDTGFVFCDVSKAFDRVWHAGLLKKLRAYGITGPLYSLIENYLSGRQQSVFVNNSFSEFAATNAGVPQGSVLGPLLFLIFINDIADKLLSISRLFADDTSMSATSQDKNELKTILNTDLNTLFQWSKLWKVTFNRVSYFPSTIRLWNNLEFEIRNNFTFNQFKYYLNTLKNVHRVPEYFNVGKRKTNIILTKLRNSCSSLHSDLFRVNLVNSPVCSCGYFTEDVVHFMLFCPNYQRQRDILQHKLDHLQPLDIAKLLFGDENLSQAANKIIMVSVQDYIHASGKFL